MKHAFCRNLLKLAMVDVRLVTSVAERKDAWVYGYEFDKFEFHGPGGFYWHGSACCKWDARAEGWYAYMRSLEDV